MTEGNEDRVGPFSSWSLLYGTVFLYGVLVIIILSVLTRALSFGAGS